MSLRTHRTRLFLAASGIILLTMAGSGQTRQYRPVTKEMQLSPDPGDWLHFRRTFDHQGYSTLDQINKQNVNQLQLVWSWQMHFGMTESTPQVHDGIMFINNASGGVQALDAVTGDLLWDYRVPLDPSVKKSGDLDPESGSGGGVGNAAGPSRPIRNLALWGDKVYTATDGHHGARLIALKALTGEVVWEKVVGYGFSAGPLVVNGKIIASTRNCDYYKETDPCFIAAHDAETGKELWRTSTIQKLGDPGPDTWSGLPNMYRAGGDNWQVGSFDPKTNLTYWGTAQAKPWIPYQRGTDGTALYTSSTVALDVDTGKMAWYYQAIPGETYDMDETFERILIDYDGKSSVFEMGKIGILWELDRKTGQYRHAYDLGYQDQGHIDPKTGQLVYDRIPQEGKEISFCPGVSGFKTWRAMAYSPKTQALYMPILLWCTTGTPGPVPERKLGGGGTGGFRRMRSSLHPKSPDGVGEFAAMDIKTGKIIWRHRSKQPPTTSALTTAGGLVIVGNGDRNAYFYDQENGKILYQTRLPGPPVGSPSTYMVAGRQYIAIPLGTGSQGGWMKTAEDLLPELKGKLLRWDMYPPGVYVFALPQK